MNGSITTKPPSHGAATTTLVLFGVGQLAGQIFRDVPSLLLLFFMTNTLGVAPAVAGLAIFVPKFVWGALCDLAVGAASDGLAERVPRRLWLLAGALLAPLAMVLLFHVPAGTHNEKALYVACVFALYMLVFALFSVPYLTIGAQFSGDAHGRSQVMAWRLVFTAGGLLIASSIGPMLLQQWGGGEPAYRRLAIVLSLLCAASLLVAYHAAGAAPRPQHRSALPGLRSFAAALVSPRFLHLLGPVFLQLVGSGLSYAALLYFVTYNLGRAADAYVQLGIIVLVITVGIVLGQPLWLAVARRLGKQRTYLVATTGYGLALASWALLDKEHPLAWSYALGALLAVCNSGWALMSFSMLGDVIADDAAENGQDRGGMFSALWVAADKIGFALGGTLLIGLLLQAYGFDSTQALAGAPQPPSAVTGIAIAFGLVPAALNVLALLWFWRTRR